MRLRFALLLVGVPLLALGGDGIVRAARNRTQVSMTCAEFVRTHPDATWLRLTGCDLDYTSPGYREADGRILEIFFPVRIAGQPSVSEAALLAATSDPQALALVQATIGNGRQVDTEAVTVMMLRVVTLLRASREIEGLVRSGILERLQTRRSLQSFPVPLASGYVVLDLHARPSMTTPSVEAGVGLLACLLFVFAGRSRQRSISKEAPQPPIAADVPAPEGEGLALPAMLLLNLAAGDGPDAIEGAPPLGEREQTLAALGRALPGLAFDERGHARFERPDVSIDVTIDDGNPVWTATVRARGDGAMRAIERIASETGWRIFVPRRGTFLEAVDTP